MSTIRSPLSSWLITFNFLFNTDCFSSTFHLSCTRLFTFASLTRFGNKSQCPVITQGDQKVSVHLMFVLQSSGAQRLFDHSVYQQRSQSTYVTVALTVTTLAASLQHETTAARDKSKRVKPKNITYRLCRIALNRKISRIAYAESR